MSEHPHYTLFIFAVVHFMIFILVVSLGSTTIEYKERYDDKCTVGEATYVTFDIKKNIPTPVYFYYELDNFYQNHFRFANSYSFDQLQGKYVDDPSGCKPIREEKEPPESDKAITLAPCGLISRYMFNDTYTLPEYFSEHDISWANQINKSFYLPNDKYTGASRWMKRQASVLPNLYENETINEHYLTWMHISPRPHFKKLYAVNNQSKIPAGPFTVIINCNYNTSLYKFGRYISLMAPGKLGGENQFIWALNLVMAVLSGVAGMVFVFFHKHTEKGYYRSINLDPLLGTPDPYNQNKIENNTQNVESGNIANNTPMIENNTNEVELENI